jgi:hypothetical protein
VDTGSPVIGKSYATVNTFNVTLIVTDNAGRTSLPKTSALTIQP